MKRLFMFFLLLPAMFALGTIVIFAPQAAAARIDIQSVAQTVFVATLFPAAILMGVDWAVAKFGRWMRVSLCALMGLILGGFAGAFLGELVLTVAPALMIGGALSSLLTSFEWPCSKAARSA